VRKAAAIFFALGLFAVRPCARAEDLNQVGFSRLMNSVFGAGNWRETGGYRTPAREDELRHEGAMTVRPGELSRHSIGRPGAPGAYDLVVDGLTPGETAARLRASGAAFRRLLPEGAHGGQGPHLHLEPLVSSNESHETRPSAPTWTVAAPTPAEEAVTRLRRAAMAGEVGAQLALAVTYEEGRATPRDLIAAYVWSAAASENRSANLAQQQAASRRLATLAAKMTAADVRRARTFSKARDTSECVPPDRDESTVFVLSPETSATDGGGKTGCLE
jgi:hypothetical protein